MKSAFIIFFLFFFFLQLINAQKPPYMRVYNSRGKMISNGFLFDTTDTTIILSKGSQGKIYKTTAVTQIEIIKTKRTTTRRIVNTTLSVIGVGAIIVLAIYSWARNDREYYGQRGNNKNLKGNQIEPTKHSKPLNRYIINNDPETWEEQRILLNRLL